MPYLGETRIFGFQFAPAGWLPCDGRMVAIGEFESLFDLIGTTYGGDGKTTFALPNSAGPSSDETALGICIAMFGDRPQGG